MNIVICSYKDKDIDFHTTKKLIDFFKSKNAQIYANTKYNEHLMESIIYFEGEIFPCKIDYVIALGGDGTFLQASKLAIANRVPMLGVNLGRLGFMSDVEVNEIELLQGLFDGNFTVEKRCLLETNVYRDNQRVFEGLSLNEAVIHMGSLSRILDITLYADNKTVNSYRANGIVISTPTGSTGYALSCGGPIIIPTFNCIVAVPICAHSLSSRPIVFSGDETIKLKLSNMKDKNAYVMVDGNTGFDLTESDEIVINRSDKELSVIKLKEHSFYEILSKKLKF